MRKLLLSLLSVAFTIAVYWYLIGRDLDKALLLVALLAVHEMGHVTAFWYYGQRTSPPIFLPFIGAIITTESMGKSLLEEVVIAIAGPIFGSIGALFCVIAFCYTGSNLWFFGALIGILLNLFNLLPLSPMDGGRIVGVVWRGFWFLGLLALGAFAYFMQHPVPFVVFIFGLVEIDRRYMRVSWVFFAVAGITCAYLSIHWQNEWLYFPACLATLMAFNRMGHDPEFDAERCEQRQEQMSKSLEISLSTRLLVGSAYVSLVGILSFGIYWLSLQ